MAAARRHGEAGRHTQGRRQPPGAVGGGCGGTKPAWHLGQGPRLRGLHGCHRKSLRSPRGHGRPGAAGAERLAHGQPADRRPLRRHVRRAGGLRGAGGAGGRGRDDQTPGHGRRLDQRGRFALPARRHGLGGVRGAQPARRDASGERLEGRRPEGRPGRNAEGRPGAEARRIPRLSARFLRRGPYRTGTAAGEREEDDRCRHRHPGQPTLHRRDHRRGGPRRHHASRRPQGRLRRGVAHRAGDVRGHHRQG